MAREQMHFSADNDTKQKILALANSELRKKSDMASVLIAEALEARGAVFKKGPNGTYVVAAKPKKS